MATDSDLLGVVSAFLLIDAQLEQEMASGRVAELSAQRRVALERVERAVMTAWANRGDDDDG